MRKLFSTHLNLIVNIVVVIMAAITPPHKNSLANLSSTHHNIMQLPSFNLSVHTSAPGGRLILVENGQIVVTRGRYGWGEYVLSSIIFWMVEDNAFSPDAHVCPSHLLLIIYARLEGNLLGERGSVNWVGKAKNEVSPSSQIMKSYYHENGTFLRLNNVYLPQNLPFCLLLK